MDVPGFARLTPLDSRRLAGTGNRPRLRPSPPRGFPSWEGGGSVLEAQASQPAATHPCGFRERKLESWKVKKASTYHLPLVLQIGKLRMGARRLFLSLDSREFGIGVAGDPSPSSSCCAGRGVGR